MSFQHTDLIFLVYIPRSGIARSQSGCLFLADKGAGSSYLHVLICSLHDTDNYGVCME